MAGVKVVRNVRSQRYRKRRPLPAMLVILVLGVVATVVWLKVLGSAKDDAGAVRCTAPGRPPATVPGQQPTTLGQSLGQEALDRTGPLPPSQALVRVVNASTQKGQAAETTEALRQLGFSQVAAPNNDPLYPGLDLDCRAQIRFGQPGIAAARTLSLVEPCAELVKDDRQDGTVDLAIGKRFDDLHPKQEARRVLEQLSEWAVQHPEAQGGLQGNPEAAPDLDVAQLAAARQVSCG